jgi:hypothetical protein
MLNRSEFANFLLNAHDYRNEGAKCHRPESSAQSAII